MADVIDPEPACAVTPEEAPLLTVLNPDQERALLTLTETASRARWRDSTVARLSERLVSLSFDGDAVSEAAGAVMRLEHRHNLRTRQRLSVLDRSVLYWRLGVESEVAAPYRGLVERLDHETTQRIAAHAIAQLSYQRPAVRPAARPAAAGRRSPVRSLPKAEDAAARKRLYEVTAENHLAIEQLGRLAGLSRPAVKALEKHFTDVKASDFEPDHYLIDGLVVLRRLRELAEEKRPDLLTDRESLLFSLITGGDRLPYVLRQARFRYRGVYGEWLSDTKMISKLRDANVKILEAQKKAGKTPGV